MTHSQAPASEPADRYHRSPGLDGLRGLAVLMVVASHVSSYHAELAGPAGVALFFILSGFLITSLLLAERDRFGDVSMKDFYARRALRLFPALLLIVLLTPVLLALVHDPRLHSVAPGLLTTVFYVQDFASATNHRGVLSHGWSLSVEEQFYLLWPFVLGWILLRTRGDRLRIAKVVWIAAGAAALWHVIAIRVLDESWTYYAPDTNAVYLLVGCGLATSLRVWPHLRVPHWLAASLLVVVCVVPLVLTRIPTSEWRLSTLLEFPVELAGAVVVLGASQLQVLAIAPARWFGRISYGLYLWNLLLIRLEPHGRLLSGKGRGIAALIAIVVSAASWYLVESPILRRKRRFQRVTETPAEVTGTVRPALVDPFHPDPGQPG